jgi:hypothetical protein
MNDDPPPLPTLEDHALSPYIGRDLTGRLGNLQMKVCRDIT